MLKIRPRFFYFLRGFAIGGLITSVLTYNYLINKIDYRISFYGYQKENNQIIPYIRLRKLIKNSGEMFSVMDEGQQLEVCILPIKKQITEFNDTQIGQILKERYCK